MLKGYAELKKVWHQLAALPVLKRYLVAFFFYNMGVQTVMLAATLYGKSELNIPTTNLIVSILLIQILAIGGSYAAARLSERIGNIKSLMIISCAWIGICIAAFYAPRNGVYQFYMLAVAVGIVMGGIQSLSRSTYAKLMPVTRDTASFFSFFDVTEKIAIVIGMFAFGFINDFTGSQRASVLMLVILFIIGFILLAYTLRTQKKLAAAQA